jgi:hypothetical protein
MLNSIKLEDFDLQDYIFRYVTAGNFASAGRD